MDALSVQLLLLAVAAFAGVAAALAAWYAIRVGLEEFLSGQKEQIYLEYTRRYQEIVKGLPATFFDRDESSGKANVKDEDRRLAHTYIDLCSEELKLRLRGMISNLVWQDWEDGIKLGMNGASIDAIWFDMKWNRDYRVLSRSLSEGLAAARQEYLHPSKETTS